MTKEKTYRIHHGSSEDDRKAELERLLALIRQLQKRAKELQLQEKLQVNKDDDPECYERLMRFAESGKRVIAVDGMSFKLRKEGGNDGASYFILEACRLIPWHERLRDSPFTLYVLEWLGRSSLTERFCQLREREVDHGMTPWTGEHNFL